ncbi:DUF4380 domain-containing protein [Xanthomonas arboricola]|uniref:DUF4380 domain-containing protein n=1 Tax=Xanthomonas arboricola TaxID=56448 RepID=UPI000E0E9DDB|nr:DUF4380 domain-containing protein [Xanthomonas arboricola]
MPASLRRFMPILVAGALALPLATHVQADEPASSNKPAIEQIRLHNAVIEVSATPAFGGRVLSFHLLGQPNILKTGSAVQQHPVPEVSATSGDIAYLGHDVWVGPQSQWWLHQQVNPARQAAAAVWPPDPYLSLATTRPVTRAGDQLELEGVPSPVTGVQLRKRVALSSTRADTVEVEATARNIRSDAIAWDLWFNTRVAAGTRVFVPVADAADIRLQAPTEAGTIAPSYRHHGGVFALRADARQDGLIQRGKVLLQPSAGWMAGFAGGQVLVIRFAHQPLAAIHPEQGQVELYLDAPPQHPERGLLEMEVHAAYRQLAPGEHMRANEQWTVLPYAGPDTQQAQQQFLCQQAQALQLANACAPSSTAP